MKNSNYLTIVMLPMVFVVIFTPYCTVWADNPIYTSITADSQLHLDRFEPYKILDHDKIDTESRWASARQPATHWIAFAFPIPLTIDKVLVYSQPDPYTLLDAQLQVDYGSGWQTIASINDNSDVIIEFNFSAVTTSNMRLYITDSCAYDDTARLYEMEFYHGAVLHPAIAEEFFYGDASMVIPFPAAALTAPPPGSRNANLMQQYFDSVFFWDDIVLDAFLPVPGHPDWGYYGLAGHTEDELRPNCYAAMANAFLSEVQPPSGAPDAARRQRMRDDAIAVLRYLTQAHVSNGGVCVDGYPWGDAWQSAAWANATALAGWIIFDYLDADLKQALINMIAHEANRFLTQPPKSSEYGDTGAEENAWNALITSLACNMMPTHPNAVGWDWAAKRYMYNTFSVIADHSDSTIGDDGLPISEWVTTVNTHPDFTVENHSLVHVGYLKNSQGSLMENAVHYPLSGRTIPAAVLHHMPETFHVLTRCMSWEGAAIYFGGNDWKVIHTQRSDINIYTLMSIWTNDPLAAYIEDVGLGYILAIQQVEGGHYSCRRDMEYDGVCASRLISSYLAHAMMGEGATPISESEFNDQVSGVTHFDYGEAIIHRTPTKFVSFTWGPKRMALAYPDNGTWVLWPHYASYLGQLNGIDASEANASLETFNFATYPGSFTATGRLNRLGGNLAHDFFYVSLPEDVVIYIERLTCQPGYTVTSRETGIIGHEYPLGVNTRTLYHESGSTVVVGVSTPEQIITINTDWFNVGDKVGYVIRRQGGRDNLVRYHDFIDGVGRVPKLQEWFSLVGENNPSIWATGGDWVCIVTFLNQQSAQTAVQSTLVDFQVDGDMATCTIGEIGVQVDFSQYTTTFTGTPDCETGHYLAADLNHNCYVDFEDVIIFLENWLKCNSVFDQDCWNQP
ncbi:MAG: discoidin domain-containing protein [Sedimentisphaerales bacterium]|nr:discoidin domain-containing protein [Sedimentisphaerales bacterium]